MLGNAVQKHKGRQSPGQGCRGVRFYLESPVWLTGCVQVVTQTGVSSTEFLLQSTATYFFLGECQDAEMRSQLSQEVHVPPGTDWRACDCNAAR